jgi:two-component system, chemotaxis family, response regulator WspR
MNLKKMEPGSNNLVEPDLRQLSIDDSRIMVLLVDDQAIIGEAVRRALLVDPNIGFHYCADPEQAVLAAEHTRPTVILQDLVMPGTDGLTLVREYRMHPALREVPIIVLSTKEESAVKSASFTAGANDYLVKLPDSIELIARVRYHSRSYMRLQQRDAAYRALRNSQQRLLETNLELQRLTHSDGLTGLSNRRYFDEYLTAEWRRAERERTELGMLMIDVDNFKSYNDTYGHVRGDDVLKQVATTIQGVANRPADLTARFGGEEFAIVLPSSSPGGVRLLAERVRREIELLGLPHSGSTTGPVLTISVGGASVLPGSGGSATQLVEAADRALYRAKNDGRNRVVVA